MMLARQLVLVLSTLALGALAAVSFFDTLVY